MFSGFSERMRLRIIGLRKRHLDWRFLQFIKSKNIKNLEVRDIPIIIISYNQLYYLKQLIVFLEKHGYRNLVIVDNHSSYPPLMEYLHGLKEKHSVHFLHENLGHTVFWKLPELYNRYGKSYYVVTDPDVVPMESCPGDFLQYFKNTLETYYHFNKVGFSLYLDDIPESNEKREKILKWETRFWSQKTTDGNYLAHIDTTFALYRPLKYSIPYFFYSAIRTADPYVARHGGWYIDYQNLTPEQEYYIQTAQSSSSWLSESNKTYSNI